VRKTRTLKEHLLVLAVTSLAVSAIGDLNLMIRIQVTLMMKRWRWVLGNMKETPQI